MEIQTPDRLVRLAVDLVNTRTRDPEKLTTPDAVRDFLLAHGESDPIELDEGDLAAVRAVREQIRPVFHADPVPCYFVEREGIGAGDDGDGMTAAKSPPPAGQVSW